MRQYYAMSRGPYGSKTLQPVGPVKNLWFNLRRTIGFPVRATRVKAHDNRR